jgi:hypothetical protein
VTRLVEGLVFSRALGVAPPGSGACSPSSSQPGPLSSEFCERFPARAPVERVEKIRARLGREL